VTLDKAFYSLIFKQGAVAAPSYFHSFFFIAFLEEAFIINMTIVLYIGYIMCAKNNNSVINNNCEDSKTLFCLGTRKNFVGIWRQFGLAPSLGLARPGVEILRCDLDWLFSDQGAIPSSPGRIEEKHEKSESKQ